MQKAVGETVAVSYNQSVSTLSDTDVRQDAVHPLGDDVIEAIGTLLAIAARMVIRVGGIAHLLAAALMMLIGLIVLQLPRGLRPWRKTTRVPIAHRRWLVAAPARWAAP